MKSYVRFADQLSSRFGKAFGWSILVMTFGVGWEVVVRRIFNAPTSWAFDVTYIMYGTLFMMGGAYTLSRDGHVRGDFIYRLLKPKTQAKLELVLYFLFFFPGITALVISGWKYASRSWRYSELSINSPAGVPIFQFKTIIVAAGILLFIQGVAQVFRCIMCIRDGYWTRAEDDIEETETKLIHEQERDVLRHGSEAVDVPGRDESAGR